MTLTKSGNTLRKLIIFALFADLMFVSKIFMEFLPNFHLLAVLITVITIVYRWQALIPIYMFVFIFGLYYGFSPWWVPYLYIWTILWAFIMLIPRNIPRKIAIPVYIGVAMLHGFMYGLLYSPFQAWYMHFNLNQTMAWVLAGLPWDIVHGIGNAVLGVLIWPLSSTLMKLESRFVVSSRSRTKS